MNRTTMLPGHLHTRPVPVPRAAGLHSPERQRRARGAELERSAADYACVPRQHSDMPICNSTSSGTYVGAELTSYARPGAADAMALPSRMNDRLHYRDGRVTDMQGNPITQP